MSPSLCFSKEKLLDYINWKLVALIDVVMGEEYNFPHKISMQRVGEITT